MELVPESEGTDPLDTLAVEEPTGATQAAAGDATEDIVVTGSRIRRKDLAGPAPVVVFTREQIQQSGRTNVGDFLQTLPEQSNAVNRGTNNSGEGTILVNLRGIGAQATLVLLNGRRLAAGGLGADDSVDLSAIPTNMIERIEVLKDGASAIYGSDAIAGVVNIITRKRFDGVETTAYGSTTTRGDGRAIDVSATVGTSNAKGGVLFSVGYANSAPIWSGNRDTSTVQRGLDLSGGGAGVPYELGSGTTPEGQFALTPIAPGAPRGNAYYNEIARNFGSTGAITRDSSTGQWREFRGSDLASAGGDGWNYQPYNYLYTPQERVNIFASGDYQLSDEVRAFFDSFYTKRNSQQTLAPEPLVLAQNEVVISADSIYNPFGRDFDVVNRRLLEFGRRSFEQNSHSFHLTAGLDGDLPDAAGPLADWFWEVAFNYNRNEVTELLTGSLRVPPLQSALGPSFVDTTGAPRCGTPGAPIAGCVPLNLFGGPGSISQDQLRGLTFDGVSLGYNELIGAQANLSGELFQLWSKRAVGLAVGYEFRSVSGGLIPDPVTAAGETTGSRRLSTEGSYTVHEVYGELSVPILEKLPAIEALELILAGRGSFYDSFGNTFNYKLGARWAPTPDFALRGTYSTAFRAPSIPDLYEGGTDDFAAVTDPCAENVEPGTPLARNCGAAANNGDQLNQQRARSGGNSGIGPEKAKIFTAGLVINPRKLRNLSLTFDYFNTLITQRIDDVGAATILQGCYPSGEGVAPKYCEFIERGATTGRISEIENLYVNVGEDHLDGIDMSGSYALRSPVGTFNLQAALAYLRRYDRTLEDGTVIRGAGTFDLSDGGYGGAFPHFRFNAGLDWGLKGFSAGLHSFFIGSYKECGDSEGDLSGGGLCHTPDHLGERSVGAYSTWDLVLGYAFESAAGRTSVTLGATNLFDAAPPRVYNGFSGTTDTYTYDMAGRTVYARINHEL